MIGFFPAPYEDELVYSWHSRYLVYSGYSSATEVFRDLYSGISIPSVEFMNNLTADARSVTENYMPLIDVIYRHTMFPEYGRFISPQKRNTLLEKCDLTSGNWINTIRRPEANGRRYLKYCPVCAYEDREMYGETFWHRTHQIYGIGICTKHGVYLKNSCIQVSDDLTRLKAAEIAIDEPGEAVKCEVQTVLKMASYMVEVFISSRYSHDSVGISLNRYIQEKQRYKSGNKYMAELYTDYKKYYDDLDENMIMTRNMIYRIFRGYPGRFHHICQLAMFAGISPEELLCLEDETDDDAVYCRVAQQTQEPIEKVRLIGSAVIKEWKRVNLTIYRDIRQKNRIEEEDQELLPKVKNLTAQIYGDGKGRPRRVTVKGISRTLHIDFHKLKKMKRCMEEMEPYLETQEHYWAREIIWAVGELERRGEPLNFKHLRGLINLRRENIQDSLEDLKLMDKYIFMTVCNFLS